MSDIIKGQKLSNGTTKTLNELRNDPNSDKAFIPGIISNIANVKIPIDSFASDSWKAWSEQHGSSAEDGFENSYYIGSGNYVRNGFAIGDNNTSSGGVNIGYNNYVETSASVSDNPAAYGNFNIGKFNSACYNDAGNIAESYNGAINIGQGNKAGAWGVNLGENNIATLGAYNIGGRCSASRGSFVMGYETIAEGGSVAIGFNNSAYDGEFIIGRDNDGTKGAGDYIIGHDNKVVNGGALILGAANSAQGNSYIVGSRNHIIGGSFGLGNESYAADGSTVMGKGSSATAGSLVLLGDHTIATQGSIAVGGETSASCGSVSIGDNGNNHKNLVADGSYNIGQNNSAKGGVYVIGNNNNGNYDVKYDANGHIIYPNTNTTILGDNNYTENYIGEYSAISEHTYTDEHNSDYKVLEADFTGKTRSLLVGNNNSAIGWNQYSIGDKNFNGSTVYAYDPETSSYKTSGLKYRDGLNSYTDFNDDLGYTLTFGRSNSAVRMFDIAIGLSSFASGGQNIAIGYGKNRIQGHNIESPDFTTTVKEGSRNIAYNSYIPGGYDNSFIGSYLEFTSSAFNPIYQCRNHMIYSYANCDISADIQSTWFTDNLMYNSYLSAANYYMATNNKIFASKVNYFAESGDNNWLSQNNISNSIVNVSGDKHYVMFSQNLICNSNLTHTHDKKHCSIYGDFFANNIILCDGNLTDSVPVSLEAWSISQNALMCCPHFNISVVNPIGAYAHLNNNFVYNSQTIDSSLYNSFNNNFISHTKTIGSILPSGDGFKFDTILPGLDYDSELGTNVVSTAQDINDTVSFGGVLKETIGCFNFSENGESTTYKLANLNGAIRLYNFGDSSATFISDSFIVGENAVSGVNHSFINGYKNIVSYPVASASSGNHFEDMNHGLVLFGDENTIDVVSANNSVSNNTVRGNKNIIAVESEFTDNRIIGNQNIFAAINNSLAEAGYDVRHATLESPTPDYSAYSAGEAKNNYRNYIAGSKNIVSNAESNNYIMGDANIVINTTPDYITYANNVVLGNAQLAKDGSNQLAIGHGNVVDGHYSMAIGERLRAAGSQLVVGRYNTYIDGTDGTNDSNSGALFIVGNGYCPVGGYTDDATRSNAMVVSADGTVSARTYRADPNSKLGKLFKFLSNDNVTPATGKLTWGGDDWSFT